MIGVPWNMSTSQDAVCDGAEHHKTACQYTLSVGALLFVLPSISCLVLHGVYKCNPNSAEVTLVKMVNMCVMAL